MEQAGHQKSTYFALLRSRNITSSPRKCREVRLEEQHERCFARGSIVVFGDSVGRELAVRLATWRGQGLQGRVNNCSADGVHFIGGLKATNFMPGPASKLPEEQLRCAPRWVFHVYGVHHLVRDRTLTYPQCISENPALLAAARRAASHRATDRDEARRRLDPATRAAHHPRAAVEARLGRLC